MITSSTILPFLVPVLFSGAHVIPTCPGGRMVFIEQGADRDIIQSSDGATRAVDVASLTITTMPESLLPRPGDLQQSDWLDAVSIKLASYSLVTDGWKGDGSVAPGSQVLDAAMDFAFQVAKEMPSLPRPMISADEDGSICFHWRTEKMMATIFIYEDRSYSYYAEGFDDPVGADEEFIGSPLPPRLIATMTGNISTGLIAA